MEQEISGELQIVIRKKVHLFVFQDKPQRQSALHPHVYLVGQGTKVCILNPNLVIQGNPGTLCLLEPTEVPLPS